MNVVKDGTKDEIMYAKTMSDAATNVGGKSSRRSTMVRHDSAGDTIN